MRGGYFQFFLVFLGEGGDCVVVVFEYLLEEAGFG